jgi:prevent-host-death family protein
MTPQTIGFSEVKARLSEITEEVNRTGRPVLVYKHNRPWVNITPAAQEPASPTEGSPFGMLRKYADPAKWALEGNAWEADVLERYAAR